MNNYKRNLFFPIFESKYIKNSFMLIIYSNKKSLIVGVPLNQIASELW